MGTYSSDRAWSDRFIPEMRTLIGPHLLVPSTLEQDTQQAADLVVLRGRDLTIACRVRRHGFLNKYGREFTVRYHRDNGFKTEFTKIVEGWGDWMFYGHATEDGRHIEAWWLLDLAHFRAHLILNRRLVRCEKKDNGDGTHFLAFNVDAFPEEPPLVIASSPSLAPSFRLALA